ncbi:MAG: helix-hairpin-helix domain-containing protein [Spirochaetes bacterium]|jgi:hypothetical protein|nr:helix-hairpin-helix domain-containing protein [Spirochaetota bacterium]
MIKTAIALLLLKSIFISFEYNETNPSMLFPYYNAASDDMPLGHLSNPAYLPLWQTCYFNIDYSRPYWMEDLNSGNIRTGWAADGLALQGAWSRFGITEYSEDIFTGSIGCMPWKFFSAGAGVSYYHINFDTEEYTYSRGIADFSSSILLMPLEWINFSLTYLNIYSVFKRTMDDLTCPGWSGGVSVKPAEGITFSWNTNKEYYDYINTFSVSTNLLPFLNIKAGYSRETSSFAAAVIILYKNITVSYGLNHHTYLGLTHKFGITFSGEPLALEQVNYNKNLFRGKLPESEKKININKCTKDDLLDAGVFSETIAERIIRYREIIGTVNRDALIKIGVDSAELKNIENRLTGFIDTPEAGRTEPPGKKIARADKQKAGFIDTDSRKYLFRKLLENGIGASESLMITELAKNKTADDFINSVRTLPDIPRDKLNTIIKICSGVL